MIKKNLFYFGSGITPLINMLFAKIHYEKGELCDALIVGNKDNIPYLDDRLFNHIYEINIPKYNNSIELAYNLINFRNKIPKNLKKEKYKNFYVYHDTGYFEQILFKNILFKKLIYLEEGFSLLMLISNFSYSKETLKGKIFRKIFGLKHFMHYLSNPLVDEAYIFFGNYLKNYSIKLNELSDIIENKKDYIFELSQKIIVSDKYMNPDYVIFGQNFGIEAEDSVKPIDVFLSKIDSTKKILLKPHPSDPKNKYVQLLKKYPNIIYMKDLYSIPYELIHAKIKPKAIVSYQSTVLITSPIFYKCKVISLLPLFNVKCKEKWINLIDDLNKMKLTNIELYNR